jgi:hypothetical protein
VRDRLIYASNRGILEPFVGGAGIFLLQQNILFCNFAENESCMSKKEALQLFGDKTIRTAWSEEEEKWYFSIIDVVAVLTDSADASAYWRKLKEWLLKEGNETVTTCHAFKMRAADGKMRQTDVADQQQLFRLIQLSDN